MSVCDNNNTGTGQFNWGDTGIEYNPIEIQNSNSENVLSEPSNLNLEYNMVLPKPININLSVTVTMISTRRLTCQIMRNDILTYVNNVWSAAGISIYVKSCNSIIGQDGIGDPNANWPERNFDRKALTDPSSQINLFVVHEVEEGNSGYTIRQLEGNDEYYGASYMVIGEGTRTVDWGVARIANTLAHEIGHVLGLEHHNTPNHLMNTHAASDADPMNGTEEALMDSEINKAREMASKPMNPWNFSSVDMQSRNACIGGHCCDGGVCGTKTIVTTR